MKVALIGLGSMGKRRIRNLASLGVHDIWGLDRDAGTSASVQAEYGIRLLEKLTDIGSKAFDLAIISTPPGEHLEPAQHCAASGIPFFTEFNLQLEESLAIAALAARHGVLGLASNTGLFDGAIARVAQHIDFERPGYFVFHLGQNLHDWHPWQRPGEHFIFRKATNGLRELLRIELPWMVDLFGDVTNLRSQSACIATSRYGIDDVLMVELAFRSGFWGALTLDLLSPIAIRRLEVIQPGRRITWQEPAGVLEINSSADAPVAERLTSQHTHPRYKFAEDAHVAEMKHVFSKLRVGAQARLRFEDEQAVLKLIDRLESEAGNS